MSGSRRSPSPPQELEDNEDDDDDVSDDDEDDVVQVEQLFLRRQEIPMSKVERYVLPHISSLFNPHISFSIKK